MKINNNKTYIAKALPILFIFCASVTTPVQAVPEEDIALTFDAQFVSIATGGQKELSRAPAVATVITAENIAQMGALNLDQVLESVPGLHVTLSSLRLTPVYSIRGIQSDIGPHVLMLVNGVPITQMWQGDRGVLSTLPIADIARVEIIRGPGSAVYGADAFAGVINVITKSAAEMDGTSVSATAGSFGTVQTAILHGKTYDNFDVAFSMQYSGTDGDSDRIINEDAQTFWDNQAGTNASLTPGPLDTRAKRLDTRLEFRWDNWQFRGWNWRQKDYGVGSGLAQALDPEGYAETDNWLVDVRYKNDDIAPNFDIESKISFMDINAVSKQVLFPRGAFLPIASDGNLNLAPGAPPTTTFTDGMIGNPEIYEQHYRADAAVFWTGMENHRWRFAVGAFYSELQGKETKNYGPGVITSPLPPGTVGGALTDVSGTEYVYAPNQNRTVYYLSVQDEWYLAADWDLTAGIRYDSYSDFGDTFNPRAALIWHPSYSLSTKLLYGQAFRAPSFQELYAQNNPVKQGNENLKPENIKTLEFALDYQHTFDQRYAASIFAYEIDDQIIYVDNGSTPQAQNVGQQEGRGFELEMQWSATYTLDILANYAYQKSRDKTNSSDAPDSPQQQAYIKANWRFLPGWNLHTQATHVMQRARAYNDNRTDIDNYTLVNLALRKTDLADHWDITVRVSNVFDKNVYEPSPAEVAPFVPGDYPLAGRSWYATAKYRF